MPPKSSLRGNSAGEGGVVTTFLLPRRMHSDVLQLPLGQGGKLLSQNQ